MTHRLTKEEDVIERDADKLRPVGPEKRARVEAILERSRKKKTISLRISEFDLEMIKERADREGLPYQTLIGALIHKYVTDQLYDKEEFKKVISGLQIRKVS